MNNQIEPIARMVSELARLPGIGHKDRLPEPEECYHEGRVGYHMHKGPHIHSRHDWQKYMAYVLKHKDD